MVNPEDSNSHTSTQLASEAVTNTPQFAIPDIDPNINRDDSTHNELGSELATEELHSLSDWQKNGPTASTILLTAYKWKKI
jgi:hypothetical protein